MVASEEVRELRLQVDKLRERLDFMAPMLSLLNVTQDYFQRVECEASVQLMRLKNARLSDPAHFDSPSKEDKMSPHSVETARWLHTMTDLMIGRFARNGPSSASKEQPAAQPPRQLLEDGALRPLPRASARPASTEQALLSGEAQDPQARDPVLAAGFKMYDEDDLAQRLAGGGGSRGATLRLDRRRQDWEALQQPQGRSGSARKELHDRQQQQQWPAREGGATPQPPQRPIVGQFMPSPAEVRIETTLEFGGLALGKGTWANAYRQATGPRRDALRLLCSTGIVTERELADDLTVISEEHIDECVAIATEMLQRWTPELGPPPQQEAKAFFEERLAALYMKRAPSPFG